MRPINANDLTSCFSTNSLIIWTAFLFFSLISLFTILNAFNIQNKSENKYQIFEHFNLSDLLNGNYNFSQSHYLVTYFYSSTVCFQWHQRSTVSVIYMNRSQSAWWLWNWCLLSYLLHSTHSSLLEALDWLLMQPTAPPTVPLCLNSPWNLTGNTGSSAQDNKPLCNRYFSHLLFMIIISDNSIIVIHFKC